MTTETEDKTPAFIVTVEDDNYSDSEREANDQANEQYEAHVMSLHQDLQSSFIVRMLKNMGRGMLYAGALFAAVMLASHIPGAHVIGTHALRAVHAVAEAAFGAFTVASLGAFVTSKVLEKKQAKEKVTVEEKKIDKPEVSINDDVATKGGNTSLHRIQKGLTENQRQAFIVAVSAVFAIKTLTAVFAWVATKIASIGASATKASATNSATTAASASEMPPSLTVSRNRGG